MPTVAAADCIGVEVVVEEGEEEEEEEKGGGVRALDLRERRRRLFLERAAGSAFGLIDGARAGVEVEVGVEVSEEVEVARGERGARGSAAAAD